MRYVGGTSGIEVMDKKSARKWSAWYETMEGLPPAERLADFNTLLWRYCRKLRRDGRATDVTRKNLRDVLRLHREFRNSFAHFTPKGWAIEKAGLPRIVGTAIDWSGRLMLDDDVSYRLEAHQRRRLSKSLKVIKEDLAKST